MSAGTTLQFANGTFALSNGSSISGGEVLISSGTVNVNGQSSIQNLRMTGGNLGGTGTLTTTHIFTWTAGTLTGGGISVIPAGAHLVINGGVSLWQRTLNNKGTTTWSGASDIGISNGSAFNNVAGALFEAQNDRLINTGQYGGTFNNAGTFRKLIGVGDTTITSVTFNNSSVVQVQSGALKLNGGGTSSGVFNVSSGALLDFTGSHNLSNATFNGPGLTRHSSGNLALTGPVTAQQWHMTGGTLGGASTLTVTQNMTWTAGSWNDGGTTIIPVSANLVINGSVSLWAHTLNNKGCLLYTSPSPRDRTRSRMPSSA